MLKEDRKSFIKSCRRAGFKYVEVAGFLGISRQRVEQILHPNKHNARVAVYKAGLVSKPCQYPNCGESITEAHHFDYNSPLYVTWLCLKHHREFHRKIEKKKIRKCQICRKEIEKRKFLCSDCLRKKDNKRSRVLYKTNPKRREYQLKANLAWRKNNPEKWAKINNKAVRAFNEKKKILSLNQAVSG